MQKRRCIVTCPMTELCINLSYNASGLVYNIKMNKIDIEALQKKWSEGGKKGGAAKGNAKRRTSEHYKQAGIKSGEARRAKRDADRNI